MVSITPSGPREILTIFVLFLILFASLVMVVLIAAMLKTIGTELMGMKPDILYALRALLQSL